ncbi:MAG: hypothetical protein ACXACF_09215 [Candidatus Hermodarchaeia archaeon]
MIIGSIVTIVIGSMVWAVIGPAVVLMGIPTPRTSGDGGWAFFEAYSWLSHGGRAPSIAEISSTYWLGFAVSIIGFCILVAGSIGIILAAVMEMRARKLL